MPGDDRPARYVEGEGEDQVVVYRASGLGGCMKAYVAMARGRQGQPTPEWMQEVFEEGHQAEPLIRERYMNEQDALVVGDQDEVELDLGDIYGHPVIVRGHIDGVSSRGYMEPDVLFEAKKFRESTWPKFLQSGIECNVNYPWQVAVYMHALDLEGCEFVGGRVSFDEWDNLKLEEIAVKHLAQPPFSLKAIRQRVASIEKLINAGFDVAEVPCSANVFPCPYYKLHDLPEEADEYVWPTGEAGAPIAMALNRFSNAAKNKTFIEKSMKDADKEKTAAAEELRRLIGEQGPTAEAAKKLVGHGFVVTHVKGKVPARETKPYDLDYFKITNEGKGKGSE